MKNSTTSHLANKDDPPHAETPIQQKQYMLTGDLEGKLHQFEIGGIKVPDEAFRLVDQFQNELAGKLRRFMPQVQIRFIRMTEMAERITTKANDHEHGAEIANALVVSTCSEIVQSAGGKVLEINRIIDGSPTNTDPIGYGPRPGFPSLRNQIAALVAGSDHRPIILIDDGSFTGGSLSYIIRELKSAGARVRGVVVGFAFPIAAEAIRKALGPEGFLVTTEETGDLLDWMPDHDFMPFMPNCGRVVGYSKGEEIYPCYTHDGFSRSTPYLLPFCPMADWTGISGSGDAEELRWLSQYCFDQTGHLFELLEQANHRELCINDLKWIRPAISVPYRLGDSPFMGLSSVRIIEHLVKLKNQIWE